MDFTNTASDAVADDDDLPAFIPAAKAAVFRSRRPALHRLMTQTADCALQPASVAIQPIDALVKRTSDTTARITPRNPETDSEPRYGLFKTVSAMRSQQGYRLRP